MTDQDWQNLGFALLITLPIAVMILLVHTWWNGHRRKEAQYVPKLVPPPPYIERAKLHIVHDKDVIDFPVIETPPVLVVENRICPCGEVCELRPYTGLLFEYEWLLLVLWAVQHGRPHLAEDILVSMEVAG